MSAAGARGPHGSLWDVYSSAEFVARWWSQVAGPAGDAARDHRDALAADLSWRIARRIADEGRFGCSTDPSVAVLADADGAALALLGDAPTGREFTVAATAQRALIDTGDGPSIEWRGNGLRVYVAASWRTPSQPAVVRRLRDAGCSVYDFRHPGPGNDGFSWRQIRPDPPPWSDAETREVLRSPVADAGYGADIAGLDWADAVVMLQPSGRSAAWELGYGCGARKRCAAVLASGEEPELMLKGADLIVGAEELDQWIANVAAWVAARRGERG